MTCSVGRYHNIFGRKARWTAAREGAGRALPQGRRPRRPAARSRLGRRQADAAAFLYVTECLEGTTRLMRSGFAGPVNIGSDEMVTINQLAAMVIDISGKKLDVVHVGRGPTGVPRAGTPNNRLIHERSAGGRPNVDRRARAAPMRGSSARSTRPRRTARRHCDRGPHADTERRHATA